MHHWYSSKRGSLVFFYCFEFLFKPLHPSYPLQPLYTLHPIIINYSYFALVVQTLLMEDWSTEKIDPDRIGRAWRISVISSENLTCSFAEHFIRISLCSMSWASNASTSKKLTVSYCLQLMDALSFVTQEGRRGDWHKFPFLTTP